MAHDPPAFGVAETNGAGLASALNDVPCAIALFSTGSRIVFANRRWTDLAHATGGAESHGTCLFDGVDVAAQVADVLATGRARSLSAVQGRLAARDAATWWDIDFVPQVADGASAAHGVLVSARDVTNHVLARREAEDTREVLRDNATRLSLAQEAASVGTWEWDIPAGRVSWSPEQFRLHGMDPDRDAPPSFDRWLAMVHPEDRTALLDAARAGFRNNAGQYQVEFRLHQAGSGAERWLLALGRVVEAAADGTPQRMLGVNLDVTERQRAEDQRRAVVAVLARSEARFRGIFDSTFQFIGLLAPDGTLLEANRTALDFGGLQAQDVVGRPFWQARWWAAAPDPATTERLRAALADAAAGHFVRYEVEVRGAGDTTAIIDFSLRPVRDASGDIVYIVPEGRDITARRAEEQALRSAEQRLRQAQDAAGLAIWEYETTTGTSWLSEGYYAQFGIAERPDVDFDRERWLAHLHPEDRERMREATEAAYRTGRIDEEFRILRADTGEIRWIHSRAVVHQRPAGPVLVGINQDITDRRTTLEALRSSEHRLRLAQATVAFGMWEWDTARDRQVWSAEQYAIHGISPSADPPSFAAWLDMVHEEDRPALICAAQDGFGSAAQGYRLVFRLRRADDGETRWILAFARAIGFDAEGKPRRLLGVNIDVTEEHALRFDLRRSRSLLETIGECSPDAIFAKDLAGRFLFANPAALAAIGRSAAEVIGHTDLDWHADRDQALAAMANDRRVVETGQSLAAKEIYDTPGLGRRIWRVNKAPLRDAEGRIVGVVGIAADITAIKRTKEELRASEARFRALVEASQPIVFHADAGGGIVHAPGWTELTGQPEAAMRGHGWLACIHPDEAPMLASAWAECRALGQPARFRYRVLTAHRGWRWMEGSAVPVRDAAGAIGEWVGTIVDIHDAKVAEQQAQSTAGLLRAIIEGTTDMVWAKDRAGRIVLGNQATIGLLGAGDRGRVIGRDATDLIPDAEQARAVMANDARIMEAGQPESVEERFGEQVFQSVKAPWRDEEGRVLGLVGVSRDVTAQRSAEAALAKTLTRLQLAKQAAGIGIYDCDLASGRIVWDARMREIWGVPEDLDVTYEIFARGVHPDDLSAVEAAVARAYDPAGDHVYAVEYRVVHARDGSVRRVAATGRVTDADGQEPHLVGTVRDVTARRAVEQALADSEQRFRSFAEASADAIYIVDVVTGRLEYLSPGFERIWGEPRDAILADLSRWATMLHPEDRERTLANQRSMYAADAQPRADEYRIIRSSDGTVRHIRDSAVPIRDAAGRVVRIAGIAHDVTDRHAVGSALYGALAELQVVYDSAPVGLCVLDADLRWVRISARLAEINGIPAEAHIGRSIRELLPALADAAEALGREILETGEPRLGIEIVGETPAQPGVVRTWVEDWTPLRDAEGRIVGINIVAQEVTEQRAAERALAESEQRFRTLADALPAFVFVTDADGLNIFSNSFFQSFVGQPGEALLGDGWAATVHPDDAAEALARWRQAVATGSPYSLEYRFRRSDGAWRRFLVRGVPDRDAQGKILRWVGTAIDVHELRHAETARGEAEERLRLAVEAANLGAWNWNLITGALDVTPRCRALYGLPDDVDPDWDLLARAIHPDDRARRDAAITRALETQSFYEVDYRVSLPDGSIAWRRSTGRVQTGPDGGVQALRGVVFDIDQQKRAEAALRDDRDLLEERVAERTRALTSAAAELAAEMQRRDEMQSALLQSQKLEALGQLTGGVAHDFNNILAAIQGGYRLLERHVRDNARARDLVRQGMEASERGARLIAQLMAFARKEELRPRRVDVGTLLRGAEDLICQTAGARVRCAFEIEEELWPVIIDPIRLETALMNLTANARDAMPSGGELTLSARRARDDELPPDLHRRRGHVRIAIADTGTGMDPETLRRAVEPFFTTKPPGKGTGLGLASAYGFAEQSGGTLRLKSTPGEGTTIELFLPRADIVDTDPEEESSASLQTAVLDRSRHGDATLLLVEDDDGVRPVTADLLRELGYRVIEASSAEAAETLAHAEGDIDMLVTDVVMPGAPGHVLAARLRRDRPELPVLYITGFGRGAALGTAPVLHKPFSDTALAHAVLRGLGRLQAGRAVAAASVTGSDRVTNRIRSEVLRDLHRRWLGSRTASGLPDAAAFVGDDMPDEIRDNALLLEVLGAGRFRYVEMGRALEERLGRRLVGEIVEAGQGSPMTEALGDGITVNYQRCVDGRGVQYDFARYTQNDGQPVLFERLLMPLSMTGRDAVAQVFGVVLFTELAVRPAAGNP